MKKLLVLILFSKCLSAQYFPPPSQPGITPSGTGIVCVTSGSASAAITGTTTGDAVWYSSTLGCTSNHDLNDSAGVSLTARVPVIYAATSSATDSAALGPELTSAGTCSGTGWTGTYPNYTAPGTTAPLTCTGFTSGQFYQTVTSIGAGGSGAVTIAIGAAQIASGTGGTVTAGLKASATSLTYTPVSTYTGTIGISAKLITPISIFSQTGSDSTGTVSYRALFQTLASLQNSFVGGGGTYNTTGSDNGEGPGYENLYYNTTGSDNGAGPGYENLYNNTTGSDNGAGPGYENLYNNTTGNYNFGAPYQAGAHISGGSSANQTSSYSIYLGANTMALANGDVNEIVIGGDATNGATGAGSNTAVIGTPRMTDLYVGGTAGEALLHSASATFYNTTPSTGSTLLTVTPGAAQTAASVVLSLGGVPKFGGTNTAASTAALLGSNCPAVTCTAAYTWVEAVSSDGSTVYIPVWK